MKPEQHSQQRISGHQDRIVFLDYLRIFAFSSVIVGHHFYDPALAYAQNPATHPWLQFLLGMLLPLFYCGGAGVVVFFFVSGYVITHVLQTEKTLDFIVKRIFRIYPLYMVAVLIQNTNSIIKCIVMPDLIPERLPTLLSQLFLVGDFFGTNYSLYGIEWTLRIEILFYVYMAILHSLNILHVYRKLFPYVLGASVVLLTLLPPFPTWNENNIGTVSIYSPFLCLGALFYLAEKKQTSYVYLLIGIVVVFFQYNSMIKTFQPRWVGSNFALLAFLLFASAWVLRTKFVATRFVIFASDLTYAAYLLHSWHYRAIKKILIRNNITIAHPDVMALILLLIACILAVRFIEKPGIRLGRAVLATLTRRNAGQV